MKNITYSKDAIRALRKIPANVSAKIRSKIEAYARNPASRAKNVKALAGRADVKRLRVGDRRVIFREDKVVIAIIKVGVRGEVYN